MAIEITDRNGQAVILASVLVAGEQVPTHDVRLVSGVVQAAQDGAWSVSVAGVNTITPGVGVTHLGKSSGGGGLVGDTGVAMLTVRQNTAAAIAGGDAQYQQLTTDRTGRLHVQEVQLAEKISVAGVDLPIKRAFVSNIAAAADTAVVAAVATKQIAVVGFALFAAGAATVTLNTKPGGAGTAITPLMTMVAGVPIIMPQAAPILFETVAGEGLAMTNTGAACSAMVWYVEK